MEIAQYQGLIGAALGAAIAILVQHFNRREQRRKDYLALAVEFLRSVDARIDTADFASRRPKGQEHTVELVDKFMNDFHDTELDLKHRLQYLEFAADGSTAAKAAALADAVDEVVERALGIWFEDDFEGAHERYRAARGEYVKHHQGFIAHAKSR